MLVLAGFFLVHHTYWVPANPGVDQNGYLVGGKMFADHASSRLDLRNPFTAQLDPYLFVGNMWIGTDIGMPTERYYPKYPLGLPVMVAAALKIGGPSFGAVLTYWINPIAMTLAVAGCFLLIRAVAGSFAALLGMLVFAASPTTLALTNDPNSHATTVCCVVWGMFFLLRWWRDGGYVRAAAAGFLLGYAATIRYTEGLLVLPLAVACVFRFVPGIAPMTQWIGRRIAYEFSILADHFHRREALRALVPKGATVRRAIGSDAPLPPPDSAWFVPGAWRQAMVALAAWALPVALLLVFNLRAFGSLTGYDPTHESSGFSWDYFSDNWETMLRQLNDTGLFFIFPLAVIGLAWIFRWSRRLGIVMCAWMLPNLLIYTLYYWAPDGTGNGYLRFFLTIFPGLVLCAMWALTLGGTEILVRLPHVSGKERQTRMSVPLAPVLRALVPGLVAFIAIFASLQIALPWVEDQQRSNLMLERMTQEAMGFANVPPAIPRGSVVFAPEHLLHHLQFVADYVLYSDRVFTTAYIRQLSKRLDPDEPTPYQAQRAQAVYDRLKNYNDKQLMSEHRKLVQAALDHDRRVFLIMPKNGLPAAKLRFAPLKKGDTDVYELKTVATWNDPNVAPKRRPPNTPLPPRRHAKPRPMDNPKASIWYIVEVTRKPPATMPATASAK